MIPQYASARQSLRSIRSIFPQLIWSVALLVGVAGVPTGVYSQTDPRLELVSYPNPAVELEFIMGPQLKSNSPLNPWPWFDQNAITKGIVHGQAFPADPVIDGGEYHNKNYYDQALAQYINYYRTGDAAFLGYARKVADSWYRHPNLAPTDLSNSFAPRSANMGGLMLRALDGRPDYWPAITNYTRYQFQNWVGARVSYDGLYYGVRDGGYMLLYAAWLARVHPEQAVREEFRQKAVSASVNYYARLQFPDGSWRWQDDFNGNGINTVEDDGLGMQPFMVGLLLEGLIATHRLDETNVAIKDSILKSVENLHSGYRTSVVPDWSTWTIDPTLPAPKWRGFYYVIYSKGCESGCGTDRINGNANGLRDVRQLNATLVHAYGYAYKISGDEKFRIWGDEVFDATYGKTDSPWGYGLADFLEKQYNQSYRAGGRYLAWRLGVAVPTPSPTPTATPTPSPTPLPTATPTPSPTPTPVVTPMPGETVWVEDALPLGATSQGESWNWVSDNPDAYSGTKASKSANLSGIHQYYFTGAATTLPVTANEILIAYVYIDPANVPREIMLQWYDVTWEHRAYWGTDNIGWGNNGTASRRYMGALPPAGQWTRLEVPANQVGLEGRTLNGMAFTLFGGRATLDRAGKATVNPLDDAQTFVRQHYLDFLGREPDSGGWDYWSQQILGCPTGDVACVRSRRINVSAAFFVEQEFQQTGSFVYRFYRSSLGRQPSYAEFLPDRAQVVASPNLEANKQSLANAWVQRTEFLQKYPAGLTGAQFIDALLQTVQQSSGTDISSQRSALIDDWNAFGSRARIVRMVADMPAFVQAEYNPAFVLMQYFGYLRRDPDPGGFSFWLDVLNNRAPNNHRGMVCAFITSAEYQLRFGAAVTHTNADCGP